MVTTSKHLRYKGTFDEELDRTIDMKELMNAIDKSKAGKAAGPDGIPAEFFKNLTTERKSELLRLFNLILDNEKLPQEWAASTTIM
jgi:hypothetical protein